MQYLENFGNQYKHKYISFPLRGFLTAIIAMPTRRASDPACPLLQVHCLATPYNIWANVQKKDQPHELIFNVLDSSRTPR